MANELTGYNLKSYETIRFVSKKAYHDDESLSQKENRLIKWFTTGETWKILKALAAEMREEGMVIDEREYYLNLIVILSYVYKREEGIRISKNKYKKLKKISKQRMEKEFDILTYIDSRVKTEKDNIQKVRTHLCEILSDSGKTEELKKQMSKELCTEFELQILLYKK